jgi:hypothetical protein
MLEPSRIHEAKRLLAEDKFSYRQIAKVVGISRASVGAIASGKRPDYEARRLERQGEPVGPLARCGGCGGLVYMPCRLCRVRKAKEEKQERLRMLRRRARQLALRKLLAAVRRANLEHEAAMHARRYLPADFGGGASDCK